MSDPAGQAQARMRAAADQFGAAIGDAFKLAMRQALAKQIADDHGDGPWLLWPDGSVERIVKTRTGVYRLRKNDE